MTSRRIKSSAPSSPAPRSPAAFVEMGAFDGVPELVEATSEGCLRVRDAALNSFVGLGPPDLVHVRKHCPENKKSSFSIVASASSSPSKTPVKTYSSFHNVVGIDCSSAATPAAYFTGLLNDQMKAGNAWRLQGGTYCTYNAFARVDVRIVVALPGSIEAYCTTQSGERLAIDDLGWKETYVSSVLRALRAPDDLARIRIDALRIFDPLPSPKAEREFLQTVQELYFESFVTGCEHPTTSPSHIHNRVVAGLWSYFHSTARYRQAIEFFEPLAARDPEQTVFLAEAYRHLGEIPTGLCLLARALMRMPKSWALLVKEAELLEESGKIALALEVSKMAVDVASGSTQAWLSYADVCVSAGLYEEALIAVNLAPMAAKEPDRMAALTPESRVNCDESIAMSIMAERAGTEVLGSLSGNVLRSTFTDAYAVLAKMLKKLGWAQMLSRRANTFVLETEFTWGQKIAVPRAAAKRTASREMSATGVDIVKAIATANMTGSSGDETKAKAAVSRRQSQLSLSRSIQEEGVEDDDEATGPSVTASSDATTESVSVDSAKPLVTVDEKKLASLHRTLSSTGSTSGKGKGAMASSLTSVATTLSGEGSGSDGGGGGGGGGEGSDTAHEPSQSASNASTVEADVANVALEPVKGGKRLCERWLDGLFMALYEDLRAFLEIAAQVQEASATGMTIDRTVGDWMRLGALAERLGYKESALLAYKSCVEQYSTYRGWFSLMKLAASEGHINEALISITQLDTYFRETTSLSEAAQRGPLQSAAARLVHKYGRSFIVERLTTDSVVIRNMIEWTVTWKSAGFDS